MDGWRMSNPGFGSDCPFPSSCQPQARETHTDLAPGPKLNHFESTGCPFGYNFTIKKNPQNPVTDEKDGKLGEKNGSSNLPTGAVTTFVCTAHCYPCA